MSAAAEPIPLILLTGFLGSGKTTLLNALLRHRDMAGTAVLVNEVGTIGIDHNLIVGASDDILLLEGGCLCCQPRGSIGDGVSRLLALKPAPKRIVIETSGAANPLPILEALSHHDHAAGGFRFPRVVTVADCVFGETALQRHIESRFQIIAADIVVLGKADIAEAPGKAALAEFVARENPAALVLEGKGDVLPDGFVQALAQTSVQPRPHGPRPVLDSIHDQSEFVTAGVSFDGHLTVDIVQDWLDRVLDSYGGNILRIKGILRLAEYERPAVLQCVRDIVHPLQLLDAQQPDMAANSIVAIGWDMHPELLDEALGWLAGKAGS